jgi:hypothetical protein
MTPAQLAALKTAINATPAWSSIPNNDDGHFGLAALLNQPASPALSVWRTDVPIADIIDAIDLSKYTPNDVVSGSDSGDALHRKNGWLLTSQTKQMNLQLLLQGRDRLNCAKPNVRAGLRDAVIQLPTGAGGAVTAPGGTNGTAVLNMCVRNATEAEKVLVTASQASDTTGSVTARVLGYEGGVSPSDVQQARNLP